MTPLRAIIVPLGMRVEWFGQSAFSLQDGAITVVIDPFDDMSAAASRGMEFDYPPLDGVSAQLVLVTHEHRDHNGVAAIGGAPEVIRSTAGRLASPAGEVVAVASEHDDCAGTERGPNSIFCFELGGLRVCHLGDFGQRELRPEQAQAIAAVDLLFVPVGGGFTIGAEQALAIVGRLAPRWVVPMHYRTQRVNFLEPADEFLAGFDRLQRLESPIFDTAALADGAPPLAVVPAAP
jgi:L-ascorbate metabolism protein UlaG (beta-lactamase superfamily)